MAYDPHSPPSQHPPNLPGWTEPKINWRGSVIAFLAIGIFVLAYVFKGAPTPNLIPYPQFVKMLEEDQVVKEKGLELVSEPGNGSDYLKGWKKPAEAGGNPELFKTPVNLQYNLDLQKMLEDKYHIAVTPKSESNLLLNAFSGMVPILIFLLIVYFIFRNQIRAARARGGPSR